MSAALTVPQRTLSTPTGARSGAALALGIGVTLAAVVVAPSVVLAAAIVTLVVVGVVALGRAAQPIFEHVGTMAR